MTPRKIATAAAAFAVVFAGAACASTTTGTIAQIATNKRDSPNLVFVRMNPQPTPEACATNTAWSYVFSMTTDTDKKTFALLEGALLAGRTVIITGTGACADYSTIESGNTVILN